MEGHAVVLIGRCDELAHLYRLTNSDTDPGRLSYVLSEGKDDPPGQGGLGEGVGSQCLWQRQCFREQTHRLYLSKDFPPGDGEKKTVPSYITARLLVNEILGAEVGVLQGQANPLDWETQV